MREQERAVSELYGKLWEDVPTIQTSKILDQFLFNIGRDGEWFAGKRCLDAGCGSGFAAWCMDELGAVCHACDLDPDSVAKVRARLGDREVAKRVIAASVLELPYDDASFDLVHCNGVLHHTMDPHRGFRELVRVLRPKGTLFISVYGRGGAYNAVLEFGRLIRPLVPYRFAEWSLGLVFGDRTVPNSFIPAKVSVLDNMYVPIRESYREREIREWFHRAGFPPASVVRTQTTIYDHTKRLNKLIHGEGYLQFRAERPG